MNLSFIFVFGIVVAIGLILTIVFFEKIKYSWLVFLACLTALSYPFERIPTVDFGTLTIKPVYILIMLSYYLLLILIFKKDSRLFQLKLNSIIFWLVGIILASFPSWFFIQDQTLALTHFVALSLSFSIAFLVSNFVQDIFAVIKWIVGIMQLVNLFAVYQLAGDMIGLPYQITGLRPTYTKINFGFARIHATALEPLFFAGMLFLPIIALLVGILTKKYIFSFRGLKINLSFLNSANFKDSKISQNPVFKYLSGLDFKISTWQPKIALLKDLKTILLKDDLINFVLLGFNLLVFFLTLSKSAFMALFLAVGVLLVLMVPRYSFQKLLANVSIWCLIFISLLVASFNFYPNLWKSAQSISRNFNQTLQGESPSADERIQFVEALFKVSPEFAVTGSGFGQYTVYASRLLPVFYQRENEDRLFVNNVYLEVWFEYGIFSVVVFVSMLCWLLFKSIFWLDKKANWGSKDIYVLILSCSLLAYCVQWLTFSPIFINPIFVIIGLLAKALNTDNTDNHMDNQQNRQVQTN